MTFVLVYLGACAVSAPAIIGLFAGSKAQRIECKSWLRAGKGE